LKKKAGKIGARLSNERLRPGEQAVTHQTDASNTTLETASSQTSCEVSRKDLPLSCPTPGQKLWNSHPRVFLPIEETGQASCPYCSTHYLLVD
jgi:uncharacterized Zn-finger protein